MVDGREPFAPRSFVVTGLLGAIIALLAIGTFGFLIPQRAIRRKFILTNCTAVTAVISCNGECRNLSITTPLFNGTATLRLRGRGNAPCISIETCNETFPCRVRTRNNVPEIRRDVPKVAAGFIAFMALAVLVLFLLLIYLSNDSLRHFGRDQNSRHAVRVIAFMPRGVDSIAFARAVTRHWPQLEARGLSYHTYAQDADTVTEDARRTFTTPWAAGKAGVVFCVVADGRNERAVLAAAPESFYRVLVLPALADCIGAASSPDDVVMSPDMDSVIGVSEEADLYSFSTDSVIPRTPSASVHARIHARDVETGYRALQEMQDKFDSVYFVGTLEFGNHYWIAVRTVAPYVSFRASIIAAGERTKVAVNEFLDMIPILPSSQVPPQSRSMRLDGNT